MKRSIKLTLTTCALMLGISAVAVAAPTYYTPDPAPKGPPAHAKAHGFHCKGFSKKHVKGQKGTPFSQCVKAMARAGNNEHMAPGRACKGFSKKHVKGQKGTPFSQCVKKVAQMRKEQQALASAAVA